jgi:fibronectin type 3 domain-containing protein
MKKRLFFQVTRKPIRKAFLALEQLESRVLPSVDITSFRNSNVLPGVNQNEVQLTPANVNAAKFGKLYTVAVDGQVYAEPLVETGVLISDGPNTKPGKAGVHDVVFVATEHDSLYAIDAGPSGGQVLWQRSFLNVTNSFNTSLGALGRSTAVSTVSSGDVGSSDINPEIGITGTPAIDATSGTLYVSVKTKETVGATVYYVQRLHAINVADGTDRATPYLTGATKNGNTNTTAIYIYGSGDGHVLDPAGSGKQVVQFNALREANRAGLELVGGTLYEAWASHGDQGPYHGWVVTWDVSNLKTTGLKLTGVLNTSPNSGLTGIWQGGGVLAMDPDEPGTFYFETGNGPPNHGNPTLNTAGFPTDGSYWESVVKVRTDPTTSPTSQNTSGWGLKIADYFMPYNVVALDNADEDLGSGAPLVLPDSAGVAGHPRLLVAAGKEGKIYLIDRDNMGKFSASGDRVVNAVANGSGHNTAPVLIGGALSTAAFYNGKLYWTGGYSGTSRSFDIGSLLTSSSIPYTYPLNTTSETAANSGQLPGSVSITASGVTNAVAWVMDRNANQIHAYDAATFQTQLWNSGQNARDSVGSVVKFASPTEANGQVYVGTLTSLVVYGLLTPPTAAPLAPTLSARALSGAAVNLSWTDPTTGANAASGYLVEESTDGTHFTQVSSAPARSTSLVIGGLAQLTTYSFRIRAYNGVGNGAYSNTITLTTLNQVAAIDYSAGFAGAGSSLTLNGTATINATTLQLTPSKTGQAGSAFVSSPMDVTKFATTFTFKVPAGSTSDGIMFVIQGAGPTALGRSGGLLGFSDGAGNIKQSVGIKFDLFSNVGEGPNSTGLYLNGAVPENVGSIDLTGSGVDFHSGDPFLVNMTYDGTTLSVKITDTVTGNLAFQSYTASIPAIVGGNTAYVGFTAATGTVAALLDIVNWTFAPNAAETPAAPSGLGGSAASAASIALTWDNNAANQTGFKLDRATDANFTQDLVTQNLPAAPSRFTDTFTGLAPGGTYYYRIRATNLAGESANSNTAPVSISVAPPAPSAALVTDVATDEIDLQWTDNAGRAATGYLVQRSVNNGPFVNYVNLPQLVSPDTYDWSDGNVSPGTTYAYRISAFNTSGANGFIQTGATTLTLTPANVTATAGIGLTTVSWTATAGAVTYNVYRSTTAGGEGTTPYAKGTTATSFVDRAVTAGTTYYYKVTAVNANTGIVPAIPSESGPSLTEGSVKAVGPVTHFLVVAPADATTGSPIAVTVSARDDAGNIVAGYNGRVHFTSTDATAGLPGDSGLTSGQGTFNVTLKTSGSQTITAADTVAVNPVIDGTSAAITARGLMVASFTPSATGFSVAFSKPFVPEKLTLYGPGLDTVLDVTLVGSANGPISGSLLLDPSNKSISFHATANGLWLLNGFSSVVLPDDTYTVTLVSGAGLNGFQDALGAGLDGTNSGGHANYSTTFTTRFQADATAVLALPDFARGPDGSDDVLVPNDSGHGVPITLYNASGVTDVTFTLTYNPTLLTVSGASHGDATDPASTLTLVGGPVFLDATYATASFRFQDISAQSGTVVLGDIVAVVPDSAAGNYKAKELLQLSAITVNGAAFTGVSTGGLHVNAYLGDVTGNGTIDGLDLATAFTVAAGNATGFTAYRFLDPAIIGDVAGDLSVDAGDLSDLAAFTARVAVPVIPPIPAGLTITPTGPDPTLSLGAPTFVGRIGNPSDGGTFSIPVLLDDPRPPGSTGMTEAILALTYDPSVLSLAPADITLGSIPTPGSWQLVSDIDAATGQIVISLYSTSAIAFSQAGSLVYISFHVVPGAHPLAQSVQLVNAASPNGHWFSTQVDDAEGQLVLSLGPFHQRLFRARRENTFRAVSAGVKKS